MASFSVVWLENNVTQVHAVTCPPGNLGGRLMAHQLYDVGAYDPFTLGLAIVALGMSAAIAGLVPARRAASIEPMVALRSE